MRRERADTVQVLLGRAAPVELAILRIDLGRVAGSLLGLGLEGRLWQDAVQQRDRERGRLLVDRAGVVLERERESGLGRDRAGVERLDRLVDRHAGLGVSGHQRPLHRRRPTPARKQRGMDVEPERLLELGLGDQHAVGGQHDDVGVELDGGVELLGLEHRDAEAIRHHLRRGRTKLAPAPGRAVGTGDEEGDLAPGGQSLQNIGTEGRGRGDSEALSHGASPGAGENDPRPQYCESLATRLGSRAVEGQFSVEVIDLVLDGARGKAVELQRQLSSVDALPFQANRDRPLDRNQHALEREAALVVGLQLVAERSDTWIDDRAGRFVFAQLDREHPEQAADLVRGQAYAGGVVHQRDHPCGLLRQRLVEDLDLASAHAQHRIRILANLRKRSPPPGLALDVVLVLVLVLDVLCLLYVSHLDGFYAAGAESPRLAKPIGIEPDLSGPAVAGPSCLRRLVRTGRPCGRNGAFARARFEA